MNANRETARNRPPVIMASLSDTSAIFCNTATSKAFWPMTQAIAQGMGSIQGNRPPTISSRIPPSAVSAGSNR